MHEVLFLTLLSLLGLDDPRPIPPMLRTVDARPGLSGAAAAPGAEPPKDVEQAIAIARPETKCSRRLTVTSPAFKDGAAIPGRYSAYEQDSSFAVSWSGAPPETKSFVLIMEDPDAQGSPTPVLHWLAWNIPADTRSLREGLPRGDRLDDPAGTRQGPTTSGQLGYRGPRPPAGDPPHRYHVQIFALERTVELPSGSRRDEVLDGLRGHVLASGELTGTFKAPARPSHP